MSAIRCDFCAWHCSLEPGAHGKCGIRRNKNGIIITEGFGQAVSLAVDPIEKKPFYHVMPGTKTLSAALFGCNFHCKFCQNATISQPEFRDQPHYQNLQPGYLARRMIELGLPSVSFTYSEPTVWQDWMLDEARMVKEAKGRNFMVTNGFFSEQARERMIGLIDGWNIDVKGNDAFYRKWCDGMLEPVLGNLRVLCRQPDTAVEVCTLVIEGIHSPDEIVALGETLAKAGLKVWHLSRFFPSYRMANHSPTSEAFLAHILALVKENVDIPFIYAGNSGLALDTLCTHCGGVLIARPGGRDGIVRATGNKCPDCGHSFDVMW